MQSILLRTAVKGNAKICHFNAIKTQNTQHLFKMSMAYANTLLWIQANLMGHRKWRIIIILHATLIALIIAMQLPWRYLSLSPYPQSSCSDIVWHLTQNQWDKHLNIQHHQRHQIAPWRTWLSSLNYLEKSQCPSLLISLELTPSKKNSNLIFGRWQYKDGEVMDHA